MVRSRLRVYHGPQATATASVSRSESNETVSVPLGEVLPLLADAVRSQRTWLTDFEQEEITISTDLYEVILAYQHFRRPVA
jgi:molybdopterin biosynthesis enzyme